VTDPEVAEVAASAPAAIEALEDSVSALREAMWGPAYPTATSGLSERVDAMEAVVAAAATAAAAAGPAITSATAGLTAGIAERVDAMEAAAAAAVSAAADAAAAGASTCPLLTSTCPFFTLGAHTRPFLRSTSAI